MLIKNSFIFAIFTVFSLSCSDSNFKGGQETTSPKKPVADRPAEKIQIHETEECPEGKITSATLQTKQLQSGKSSQELVYIMELSDCNGPQAVISQSILFDIDYASSNIDSTRGQPFRVETVNGKEIVKGNLEIVRGTDLFGNTSESGESQFYHYRTDKKITVNSDTLKIKFIVDFSGVKFYESNHNSTKFAQTFLAFADAKVTPATADTKVEIIGAEDSKPRVFNL